MHRSVAVSILVSILCFCWPGGLSAEDIGTSLDIWDFDSITPADATRSSPAKEVCLAEIRGNEKWNTHALDGFLDGFWNLPQLRIVQDEVMVEGFQNLCEKYKEGYADRERIGSARLERTKIQLIDPNIAFAPNIWTINYGRINHATVGTGAESLRKFGNGWTSSLVSRDQRRSLGQKRQSPI
jgi:hypothetical protein